MADFIKPELEEGVPVMGKQGGVLGPHRTFLREMKVNQSFAVYGIKEGQFWKTAVGSENIAKNEARYTMRKIGEATWRIWRTA